MINSSIPLAGQGIQTSNALISAGQAADQRKQAELNRQQTQKNIEGSEIRNQGAQIQNQGGQIQNEAGQMQNKSTKEQHEMFSLTKGAIDTLGYLDNGDVEGLKNYYTTRKAEIEMRGGNSADTQKALQLLESGNIDQLAQQANQVVDGAQKLGIIKPPNSGKTFSKGFHKGIDENGDLVYFRGVSDGGIDRLDGITPVDPVQQKVAQQDAMDTQTQSGQAALELKRAQSEKADADAQAKQEEVAEKREKGIELQETGLNLINQLIADESTMRHFGRDSHLPTLRQSTRSSGAQLDQLKKILTSENLGLMSGVLSETDIQIIAAIAGGGLDSDLSDDVALKNLYELKNSFERRLGIEGDSELPPLDGAKKAPDGNWYVEQNGQYYKVEQ